VARTRPENNIPLGQLRIRLGELHRDREVQVICRSGQRADTATRILLRNGYQARTLSGVMLSRATSVNGNAPSR
jgi:rhodanese-related sulfurtransferase